MLVVVTLLLAGAIVVWFQVLKPEPKASAGCNPPGPAPTSSAATTRTRTSAPATGASSTPRTTATSYSPPPLGKFTDKNTLRNVRPASPSAFGVRVFNASTQRGMARTLSDELRLVGFAQVLDVDNDSHYPALDLGCVGEIRYGEAGVRSARTTLLLMPCAQLVVDNRVDDSVDIVIGKQYTFENTSDETKKQLATIREAAAPPAVIDGRTVVVRSVPPIPAMPAATCPS